MEERPWDLEHFRFQPVNFSGVFFFKTHRLERKIPEAFEEVDSSFSVPWFEWCCKDVHFLYINHNFLKGWGRGG